MHKIYYSTMVYDHKEAKAVINVLKNHNIYLIDRPYVKNYK